MTPGHSVESFGFKLQMKMDNFSQDWNVTFEEICCKNGNTKQLLESKTQLKTESMQLPGRAKIFEIFMGFFFLFLASLSIVCLGATIFPHA